MTEDTMSCRDDCAACCIAPSITQSFANAPQGKAADEPCPNLDMQTLRCRIWGQSNYPSWCKAFKPEASICGNSREEALEIIRFLEKTT
ncbi:YkgJ family cysteine cluster protein [Agaribacterium sp. ZY112]|uniref:YkgJ family cysteine cluster protein n=1 Tax=Agaribacterium sp. ZY112 TaxID=3233574 RepID=UPI003525A7DB